MVHSSPGRYRPVSHGVRERRSPGPVAGFYPSGAGIPGNEERLPAFSEEPAKT